MAYDDEFLKKPGEPARPMARGTGFSGIKRVLQASAGSRIGEPITGRLQAAGETARTGISTASEKFRKETEEQKKKMEEEQLAATSALQGITSGQLGGVESAAGAFQRRSEGKYAGPTGLSDVEKVKSKVTEAEQLGKQIKTTGGRQELLTQQFGQRGGYGRQQSALDALILGKTAGSKLAQAGSQLSRISPELSTLETGAAETGKGLQKIASGYGSQLKDQFGNIVSGIKEDVSGRKAQYETASDAEMKALENIFSKGEVSGEQTDLLNKLQKAGITEGTYLGDLTWQDVSALIKKGEAPSVTSVTSPEELAKLKALQRLGGMGATPIISPILGQYEGKESEVGTYKPEEAVSFKGVEDDADKTKFKSALQKQTEAQKTNFLNKKDELYDLAKALGHFDGDESMKNVAAKFGDKRSLKQIFEEKAASYEGDHDWNEYSSDRAARGQWDALSKLGVSRRPGVQPNTYDYFYQGKATHPNDIQRALEKLRDDKMKEVDSLNKRLKITNLTHPRAGSSIEPERKEVEGIKTP